MPGGHIPRHRARDPPDYSERRATELIWCERKSEQVRARIWRLTDPGTSTIRAPVRRDLSRLQLGLLKRGWLQIDRRENRPV